MDNSTIQRKIEIYKVELVNKENETYKDYIILQEFFVDFFTDYSMNLENSGYSMNSSKKCWVSEANLKNYAENDVLEVKLNYTKFNKKLNVIDINTRKVVAKKGLNNGDDEKQHFSVKFFPESNYALILYEKIQDSVSMSFLRKTMNDYLKKIFIKSEKYNKKIKPRDIKFYIDPIVSQDFIKNIADLKEVKLLKTVVTKESIDKDFRFSGSYSRDEAELIVKAENRLAILKNDVINYCNKFLKNGIIKDQRILRIVIHGFNDINSNITIDTDGMKLSETIKVNLDSDNTVDSQDIFDKLKTLILEQSDKWNFVFNVTFKEKTLSD